MSRRTKREVAPSPAPARSAGSPWSSEPDLSAALQTGGKMAPPPGAQPVWLNGPVPEANKFGFASPDCGFSGTDLRPPGGFMSYFQTGQQPFIPAHVPFPPWPPMAPAANLGIQHATLSSKAKPVINIDDGDDVRTAKRLIYEPDGDLRLVSAWLYHSNDPINGNCKKNESYWADVVELYNSTTPVNRKREVNHLKDRWQRVKKSVGFFCASWTKATSIYTSGYSDLYYFLWADL